MTYIYDPTTMDVMMGALEIDEVRPLLLSRVELFSANAKEAVFSKHQRPEFVEQAIRLYAKVEHFRDATRIGRTVISPFANILEADHVRQILEAVTTNYELYMCNTTSEILVDLFERTADLRDVTKTLWQNFLIQMMKDKDPETRSAYPAVRGVMEKAGIWPPQSD